MRVRCVSCMLRYVKTVIKSLHNYNFPRNFATSNFWLSSFSSVFVTK